MASTGSAVVSTKIFLITTLLIVFSGISRPVPAELPLRVAAPIQGRGPVPIDAATLLRQIEQRVLLATIVDGEASEDELPDYYWAANSRLHRRLLDARSRYESSNTTPFRSITLIAGPAGIGKTFIKGEIVGNGLPERSVLRFDIKELYEEWEKTGKARRQPELEMGPFVLSEMLSSDNTQTGAKTGTNSDTNTGALLEYLEDHDGAFYIIDSLDEIHPDEYSTVLRQIERFVLNRKRPFTHVVVLGRPCAFYDYWQDAKPRTTVEQLSLHMLRAPQFRTTGDLLVSSWNYHTWKYKLRWTTSDGTQQKMPLATYERWFKSQYSVTGPFKSVSFTTNNNLNPPVQATWSRWVKQYRYVGPLLRNLAANGMLREIAAERTAVGQADDELAIKLAFLESWINREARCEGRPCGEQPEQLRLYLSLLRNVALKYAGAGHLDTEGGFLVAATDMVKVSWQGRAYEIPVTKVLDRSGLATLLPTTHRQRRYRFEPIWIHRLLLETEPIVVPDH